MQTTPCPICDSDVIIAEEMNEGDLATCATCGAELEIVSLHPLQLRKLDDAAEEETDESDEIEEDEEEEEEDEEEDE